jgi:Protein of unknown function (DUF4232)
MRTWLIAAALVAGIGVAACGGGSRSGAPQGSQTAAATAARTSTAAASSSTVTATATATATVTASPTTAAGPSTAAQPATSSDGAASVGGPSQQCRAAGLALSFLGGEGATGHGELGFTLRNTGSACSTGGYPGIQFLGQAGGALPTSPVHTTSDFFGQLPLRELTVAPGQSVSFRLGVSHGDGSSAGCVTAYGLQVIAPNDTATLRVPIPNGASECGSTTVSPVEPGTAAYP